MEELVSRVERRVNTLPRGLRDHIYRVKDIAIELAPRHGVVREQAALAMMAHDVARAMRGPELLTRASNLGLPIGISEQVAPVLLHGPVGAEILTREDGLSDRSIHQAVYWHTTAHPTLDTLGKVVFLADKLDPQRISAYPYQLELRRWAMEDLDRAILEFLTRETIALASRGMLIHPMVIETRNHLLANSVQSEELQANELKETQEPSLGAQA